MDIKNINLESITNLDELIDLWNVTVSQRNFINKQKKTETIVKELNFLDDRLEQIKKHEKKLKTERRKQILENKKRKLEEEEFQKNKRDKIFREDAIKVKESNGKNKAKLESELTIIKTDLDEKEKQLNQFIKEIGLDKVKEKYKELKKQVNSFDLYKGIKCTHPYQFDNAHRYVVSYGFDTEYCHTCPLCEKTYNY